MMKRKRVLGFRDLVLFYVAAGLSLRWIATAAAAGPWRSRIWMTALLGVFVPLAACVFDLSPRYPAEGGLYVWTDEALGPFSAFISAWTYWMSNLPYFPAVLFFATGGVLYGSGFERSAADSQIYFLTFTVVTLALITLLNVLARARHRQMVEQPCAIGSMIPALGLIALGCISASRFGPVTHFGVAAMVHAIFAWLTD
jgi:amino acid transporter